MSQQSGEDLPLSFETALARLEAIVQLLEAGDIELAEALSQYEQGVHYLRHCQQLVERAERRIELLCGVDAQGNPLVEPFDPSQSDSLADKAASRSRRRSRKSPPVMGDEAPGGDVDASPRLF